MKTYLATASSDWGGILYDERIEASSLPIALARAARLAHKRGKKRAKELFVKVRAL